MLTLPKTWRDCFYAQSRVKNDRRLVVFSADGADGEPVGARQREGVGPERTLEGRCLQVDARLDVAERILIAPLAAHAVDAARHGRPGDLPYPASQLVG